MNSTPNAPEDVKIFQAPPDIDTLFETYASIASQIEDLNTERQKLLDAATPPEIKIILDNINAHYNNTEQRLAQRFKEIETLIKQYIVAIASTYKHGTWQAVYYNGRITWDSKALEGFAVAHPEINAFKKTGEPSVQMRRVKYTLNT